MGDLVEWLAAQLDEDERAARAAMEPDEDGKATSWWWDQPQGRAEQFISRWDPARVLAEVAAKREILALCSGDEPGNRYYLDNPDVTDALNLRVIHALAQPYRGRPGWRDEWTTLVELPLPLAANSVGDILGPVVDDGPLLTLDRPSTLRGGPLKRRETQ